jgi:hypothetical protein
MMQCDEFSSRMDGELSGGFAGYFFVILKWLSQTKNTFWNFWRALDVIHVKSRFSRATCLISFWYSLLFFIIPSQASGQRFLSYYLVKRWRRTRTSFSGTQMANVAHPSLVELNKRSRLSYYAWAQKNYRLEQPFVTQGK